MVSCYQTDLWAHALMRGQLAEDFQTHKKVLMVAITEPQTIVTLGSHGQDTEIKNRGLGPKVCREDREQLFVAWR